MNTIDAEKAEAVQGLLEDYRAQGSEINETYKLSPPSAWLASMGILNEEYLKKLMLYICNLNEKIKNVGIKYDKIKQNMDIVVYLSKWNFWVHRKKVMDAVKIFAGHNLTDYQVSITIEVEK